MQCPEVQAGEQTAGGLKIDTFRRKGSSLAPFLIVFLTFLLTGSLHAADKKPKRPQPKPPIELKEPTFRDRDISAQFRDAEERLKKGGAAEALKLFLGVYDYAKTGIAAMDCVSNAYTKLGNDAELEQNVKEDLFLNLQRIATLKPQYVRYRMESAYHIGFIYAKRGDYEQGRKYLLEVCETAPASLDPASVWMKAKTLLLETLYLQGEF